MVWEKRMSNAMGGKSARPCDNCIKRRARWYCAADDAFLCQSCDSSVHSANPLARRHERVRLNTPSLSPPTWHTRKPRTPRQKPKSLSSNSNPLHMVPEYSTDANDHDDHLLLYRVPVLCDDFAADVDSLFGDNPLPFDMEGLGLGLGLGLMMDSDVQINSNPNPNYMVKIEEEIGEVGMDDEIGFQLDFEYEEEDAKVKGEADVTDCGKTTPFLNLDHESVLSAWGHHKSPWTSGHRPNFDSDQLCPASFEGMGMGIGIGMQVHGHGHGHGEMSRMLGDGGREAKVSRYREKRRTRLFAKKIRYEVRKLNAEKRPRMKGRFVKRPVFTNMLAYSHSQQC